MNAVFIFRFVANALEGRLTVVRNAALTANDAVTGRIKNDIEKPKEVKKCIAKLKKGVDGDCGKKTKNMGLVRCRNTGWKNFRAGDMANPLEDSKTYAKIP